MVRSLHPETQPHVPLTLSSRGENSLPVPAVQIGLAHVPVTVFDLCIIAKDKHQPGSLGEVSPEPASNQAEWTVNPSFDNMRTMLCRHETETAENDKF